ncbi:uncharacterized protein DUF4331 [Nonlabens dokdonensis]|uniref:DUF4331 domain-containing protein n=2 Tax=Nonlabens dokdonensis TaxID=328515 RepID=L7WDW0_NONDD|nr:DUF4331 family protein [Nonlabens dokdonensis]AGC78452.1 hypothetical protein DDD_3325 [Nonlabens dokdonensis DSW-6]PZX38197.1 uncharacterized protein DUF4331 [Nonlabens dokdonensis]
MKIFKYILTVAIAATLTVSCDNDDDFTGEPVTTDFTGTFTTQDQMGRPGINTVLSGSDANKNNFNVTTPETQLAQFSGIFNNTLVAYYNAYGASFENNILGLDQGQTTAVLSLDVLQVAQNAPTSYFTDTSSFLTGRRLEDDVIDVSLIVLFGGNTGARFDGMNGTPNLVSDNVGLEPGVTSTTFPYLVPASF